MKKAIISSVLIVIGWVVLFGVCSFANWQINPGKWYEEGRILYAIASLAFAVIVIFLRHFEPEKK